MARLELPEETAWLAIRSPGGITGFQLFDARDGKQLGGYTGVDIKGREGVLPKIEERGWTGLAFVNLEDRVVTITLTAYEDTGIPIAAQPMVLLSHEKWVGDPEEPFESSLTGATYIGYVSDGNVVAFQLNGSDDGVLLDALPGM